MLVKVPTIKELSDCGGMCTRVSKPFYQLFYFMEEESIFDPLNELHLMGLHFVYVPVVNKKLNLCSNQLGPTIA